MAAGIFYIVVGIIFFIAIINTVKKQRSFEKESFYWVVASMLMVLLAINPYIISKISKWVNIKYPPSLLFLIAILFILYLLFKMTCQISILREQNKELAQQNLILEMKYKELNKEISNLKKSDN